MNTVGAEAARWIFQQDYLTFLAVLGWLTAGLVAWGNDAPGAESRSMPWKWFAFFCFFLALDGVLSLAKMIAPQVWPPELDATVRLAGYGYLLEFARQGAQRLHWARLAPGLPVLIVIIAQGLIIALPGSSPWPELLVALLAGGGAGAVITAGVSVGSRTLLAAAAVLPLLAPQELLRGSAGAAIDGPLLVTGEGFAAALCAAVLAWVASTGLWLHGVFRRRTGLFAGRPEAFSPLAAIVLPAALIATLVAGYFLVNLSSDRARAAIERDYRNRAKTAALSLDPQKLAEAIQAGVLDPALPAARAIAQQVRALHSVSDDVMRVYLWNVAGNRILLPQGWLVGEGSRAEEAAIVGAGVQQLAPTGNAHILGPLRSQNASVVIANAPIFEPTSRQHLAWLAFDISATEWLMVQAIARFQTIAIVGLFASLLVFFLAHVLLREREAELLVGKERAEAADRAKDEFLAVISHEIRTPMQSVLGYGELMARTPLTQSQATYLDTIRAQGRTLLRIVQDILDFSTLRKSSYTLKQEAVYLHRLVESAFESIRPLAARKQLRFEFSIGNNVPEVVVGDGVRIEQILLNLLGNSVKFTDRGGMQLDVTLERTEQRPQGLINWVLFAISDTGMGIRPEDLRKLFQPFTRLTAGDNVRREGTGLGLAIVKRLCELMGGRIDLESEYGKGTRFFARLPLISASAPATAEQSTAPSLGAPPAEVLNLGAVLPLRVLVAEDNPYIRRLMVEYLRSIGYEPVAVESGSEAVARWRDFDLLLMDLRMPGLDGVTAAERIRAASGESNVPWIIGVSATLGEAEIERAMQAGMNDFLGKPFFVQSLIEAIQASPLFANRSGEPPVAGANDGNAGFGATSTANNMSWMPDLSTDDDLAIVHQALAEVPQVMAEIDTALRHEDLETAADRAHYLKNTVFALRIDPMVGPCRSVFERAQSGDLASARQSLETLRTAFEAWSKSRASNPAPAGEPGASG